MISYQQQRIEHSYIPNLRARFKTYDADRTRNDTNSLETSSTSDDTLSVFRMLLFDRNTNGTSILENHMRLIIESYTLRRTSHIKKVLYSSPSATSRSKSLWLDICRLARLRVAFHTFKGIAYKLPSFRKVTITLVPRSLAPTRSPSQHSLNLKQTFGILQLDLNPATTEAVLGQNWTVTKIEREFAKRQKQKPNIHAEVQMLMFLCTNESSRTGLFPYIGCSKLSCFMCTCFIKSYGQITTRGCHGGLFKPWTVPSVNPFLPGQANRLANAVMSVQEAVEKKLVAAVEDHIWYERTSDIDVYSVLDGRQEGRLQTQLQIDLWKMKAERDRVAKMFRR
jgi:hypothetical protein